MPIKPELRWVPRPAAVDAWLRLPSDRDDEQVILVRLDEIKGVRPLGSSSSGSEVTVERGYFRTSAPPEVVEELIARARTETGMLAKARA